jgi:predicted porin
MIKRISIIASFSVAALAAPAALGLNLDIWGVAHMSVDGADNGQESDTYIASNSSRLAVSGDQGVTDNLKIVFQYESGVDLTGRGENDGNGGCGADGEACQGQLFTRTRDAFVGLSGGFGKLLAGRLGGLNQWVYDYNLFADQVGDLGNIWGGTGLFGRVDDTIHYETPDLSGFTAAVTYAPDEGVDDTAVGVGKLNYGNGGIKLGAAYMSQGTGLPDEHTAWALTGSYDGGNFTVGGGYQGESDIGGVPGADRDGFTVGGSIKLGKGALKGQASWTSGEGDETDAVQYAVGYDYDLAENATIYIAYASTKNDALVAFSANDYGHGDNIGTAGPGEDPKAVSLGIVYKFNARLWPR